VLELLGVDPVVFLDAETAKKANVRRWSAETNAAKSRPLASNRGEGDLA
jgi:hypothetical protein